MENIEIKKGKNKRSIESLIDQSALDGSFNYEAHQLRKAFNQTLLSMNAKHLQRQRELEKLKIIMKQYEQIKSRYESRMSKLQEELSIKNTQYHELSQSNREMKKKLHYLQYKFENITDNRNLFESNESYDQQDESVLRKKLKTEIYNQFNKIISKKIEYFTEDIKKLSMSYEVQQKLQSFLQELLYVNPYSQFHILEHIRHQNRPRPNKVSNKQSITQLSQWRMLEKSLQKLKQANKKQPLLQSQNHNTVTRQKSDRSISTSKRRKLFNH